jgi:hypothetical protein
MEAKQGGNFKEITLPKPQPAKARCYSIIHVGTVPNIFNGKPAGIIEKIKISWELCELKAVFKDEVGPQPFVITEDYRLSTKDNSNLAKLIAQWRGRPLNLEEQKSFDPTKMLGKAGLINFEVRKKSKYVNEKIDVPTNANSVLSLIGIMPIPESMGTAPALQNPKFVWDWDEVKKTGFDVEKWKLIPAFIQKQMIESEEYKKFAPANLSQSQESNQSVEPQSIPPSPVSEDTW